MVWDLLCMSYKDRARYLKWWQREAMRNNGKYPVMRLGNDTRKF